MFAAIIIGIILFMFLVIIHEYGHFSIARLWKVKVQEFGLGIPPRVTTLAKDKKGTAYTLNAIPLGGFVSLKGENPNDETEFLAPDSFISASLRGKLAILFAGIAANTLFAWIAFSLSFWHGVTPLSILPDSATSFESTSYLMPSYSFLQRKGFLPEHSTGSKVITVNEVVPQSRASSVGIQTSDILLDIDGTAITTDNLTTLLRERFGKEFLLNYQRGDKTQQATIKCGIDECLLGIGFGAALPPELQNLVIKFGPKDAFLAGRQEIVTQTTMSFKTLGKIGKGFLSFNKEKVASSTKSLSGPVGIIKMVQLIVMEGKRRQLIAFAGMISLALAIFNVLPIPALDGGRALSVLIQTLGGRKPTTYFKIEGVLNMFFFVLLMALGIVIIFKDLHTVWGVALPFIG